VSCLLSGGKAERFANPKNLIRFIPA